MTPEGQQLTEAARYIFAHIDAQVGDPQLAIHADVLRRFLHGEGGIEIPIGGPPEDIKHHDRTRSLWGRTTADLEAIRARYADVEWAARRLMADLEEATRQQCHLLAALETVTPRPWTLADDGDGGHLVYDAMDTRYSIDGEPEAIRRMVDFVNALPELKDQP